MIPENGEVKVIMTPRISVKGDIDLRAISSFFLDAADKIQEKGGGTLAIAVEDVHSIHNSSAASNFTFGGRRREPNAIPELLARHPELEAIVFNGGPAEALFRRHVAARCGPRLAGLALARLPSTSPAHAARTYAQKLAAWRRALDPFR